MRSPFLLESSGTQWSPYMLIDFPSKFLQPTTSLRSSAPLPLYDGCICVLVASMTVWSTIYALQMNQVLVYYQFKLCPSVYGTVLNLGFQDFLIEPPNIFGTKIPGVFNILSQLQYSFPFLMSSVKIILQIFKLLGYLEMTSIQLDACLIIQLVFLCEKNAGLLRVYWERHTDAPFFNYLQSKMKKRRVFLFD